MSSDSTKNTWQVVLQTSFVKTPRLSTYVCFFFRSMEVWGRVQSTNALHLKKVWVCQVKLTPPRVYGEKKQQVFHGHLGTWPSVCFRSQAVPPFREVEEQTVINTINKADLWGPKTWHENKIKWYTITHGILWATDYYIRERTWLKWSSLFVRPSSSLRI